MEHLLFWSKCSIFHNIFKSIQSKKDSKDQELIQSSTTPVPGYQMGKKQNDNKHHKQEPRGQVTTRQQ